MGDVWLNYCANVSTAGVDVALRDLTPSFTSLTFIVATRQPPVGIATASPEDTSVAQKAIDGSHRGGCTKLRRHEQILARSRDLTTQTLPGSLILQKSVKIEAS
jgi:hypothetical protein